MRMVPVSSIFCCCIFNDPVLFYHNWPRWSDFKNVFLEQIRLHKVIDRYIINVIVNLFLKRTVQIKRSCAFFSVSSRPSWAVCKCKNSPCRWTLAKFSAQPFELPDVSIENIVILKNFTS